MASSSTGRIPQGEVVIDFADGGSYVRHRLENAVLEVEKRKIQKEERLKAQKAMEALEVSQGGAANGGGSASGVKNEDVDFIVAQLHCTPAEAESALKEEKDLVKALIKLVTPRPRARSVDGGAEVKA